MILITNHQLQAFRKVQMETFFKRTERFLKEQIPLVELLIPDIQAFVSTPYKAATNAGKKTEREIVHYILNEIEKSV